MIKNHYRSSLDYNENSLIQAERELERVDEFIAKLKSVDHQEKKNENIIPKAEREFERIGYKNGIARCYHAKALNYKAQRHYYFAIEYLSEALKIAKKSYSEKKHVGTRGLINEIRKEIGNVLEITGGEFEGKNSYEWWTENFHEQ